MGYDKIPVGTVANVSNVTSGAGAPATAPAGLGDVYVDTSNKVIYQSKGTVSASDWQINKNPYIVISQEGNGDYNGTDETPIISAISALSSTGGYIAIKNGNYTINNPILYDGNKKIIIIGLGEVIFTAGAAIDMLTIGQNTKTYTGFTLHNITIDGNSLANCGIKLRNHWHSDIGNFQIKNCIDGLHLTADTLGSATGINNISKFSIHDNEIGIKIDAVNGTIGTSPYNNGNNFADGYLYNNEKNLKLEKSTNSDACKHHKFTNIYFQVDNASHNNVECVASSSNIWNACTFDSTGGAQIVFDANSDNNIIVGVIEGTIDDSGSNNNIIDGNEFVNNILMKNSLKINNVEITPLEINRLNSNTEGLNISINDNNCEIIYNQDADGDTTHYLINDINTDSTGGGGYIWRYKGTELIRAVNDKIEINKQILPKTTEMFNIGSNTHKINTIYCASQYVFNLVISGNIFPSSINDASANNNSIYYSTDAGKLVYKDSSGVVNNLY